MAIETGVPTSISQTYANPTAALDFAGRVIPQSRQLAQEDAKIDLLRLEQERQNKIAEQQIRGMALKNALETALFDTRIEADKATARQLILENDLKQNQFDQKNWNEPRLGEIMGALADVDHEKLAGGDLDHDFNTRIGALRGIEAQEKARLALEAQRKRSFDLIQQVTNAQFDSDIRELFNKEWASAGNSNKRSVLEKHVGLQMERNLVNEAEAWNRKVATVAPTLNVDVAKLKGQDGRVNAGALRSALSNVQARYNAAEKEVNDAMSQDERRVEARTRARDERLRFVEGSIHSLYRSNSRHRPVPGGSSDGATTGNIPAAADTSSAKQLELLHAERATLLKQDPRREWDEYIDLLEGSVANAILATRQIDDDKLLSPAEKEAARKQVEQGLATARGTFDNWIGRPGASRIYDGSMVYNPRSARSLGLAAIGKNQ